MSGYSEWADVVLNEVRHSHSLLTELLEPKRCKRAAAFQQCSRVSPEPRVSRYLRYSSEKPCGCVCRSMALCTGRRDTGRLCSISEDHSAARLFAAARNVVSKSSVPMIDPELAAVAECLKRGVAKDLCAFCVYSYGRRAAESSPKSVQERP